MRKLTATLIVLCLCILAHASKLIPNGSTSQSISVVIFNADGDPNASVTITDLDLYIQLDGNSPQSAKVDLTAHSTATDAWDDYKAFHLGNGLVRIDIPDANMSNGAGANLTYIVVDGATSNRTSYYEVQLETATVAAIPTAAVITDAVWDEASSDHETRGTMGWLMKFLKNLWAPSGSGI